MNGTTDLNFPHRRQGCLSPITALGRSNRLAAGRWSASVERFYLLNIKASSLKVMVPCQNAGSVGLRRVVRNGEIQKVLDALSGGENGGNGDWKDRFKENSERMRTGSLLERRQRH